MPDRNLGLGLMWAFLTVLSWSGYNLAAVVGIDQGFSPTDLSLLRYGVSGLLLLPIGLWFYRRDIKNVGLVPFVVLSLVGGPIFGTVATAGYQFAPLSHGLVFAPTAVLFIGQVWSLLFGKPGFGLRQHAGSAMLVVGLIVLSGFDIRELGPRVLIGDAIFFCAGLMWGTFTYFIGHWRIAPGPVTCGVAALSLVQVAGFILLTSHPLPQVSEAQLVVQAVLQGIVGGGLAVLTFALAINHLGGARASALPSFTPVMGFVLSYLFLGAVPGTTEFLGSIIASLGLLMVLSAGKEVQAAEK